MEKETWHKLQGYATIAYEKDKCEIGGMLVMNPIEGGGFLIHSPVILEQTVSSVICNLDKDALAEHYCRANTEHPSGTRHVWWHSHHMMGVTWSGTDTDTIEETGSADFTVSLVINLKGDHKLRVQYFNPILSHIDTELEILGAEGKYTKEMEEEYKQLVSKTAVTTAKTYTYGTGVGHVNHGVVQENIFNSTPSDYGDMGYGVDYNSQWVTKLSDICYHIDANNADYAAGECTYADWLEQTCALNENIKSTVPGLRVKKLKTKQLDNFVLYNDPHEMLLLNDKPLEKTFPPQVLAEVQWGRSARELTDYRGYM